MSKDYYKILGVDRNASQDDIKKAFRKMAHEHHPDKAHGDEAKFKEANEAYQVLGDQKKKAQYDQFGAGFENMGGGGGHQGFNGFGGGDFNINMDDLGDLFGGFGDIFGFGGGRSDNGGGARQKRGRDLQLAMTIEFMEAVFGVEKEISLRKKTKCSHCNGNGAEPGSNIETCKTCGGHGQVRQAQRTVFGTMQVQVTCPECHGEGKTYSKKCTVCRGSGATDENIKFKAKIPAGIDNGESIRLAGFGEAGERGGMAGDLYLKIRVTPDRRFEREGLDIKTKAEISFSLAALGGKIEVETVHGKISLKIPEGTQASTTFKIKGKGVQGLRGGIGDHYVKLHVKTPTGLSKKQKQLLAEMGL